MRNFGDEDEVVATSSGNNENNTIVIEVRDADENPVEGAKVDIQTPVWPASGTTAAGHTDSKGQVRITDPDQVKIIGESSQNTVFVDGQVSNNSTSLNPGGHVFHKK